METVVVRARSGLTPFLAGIFVLLATHAPAGRVAGAGSVDGGEVGAVLPAFFEPLTPPRRVRVMARGGARGQAPESTPSSISICADDGIEWAAVTLRLTRDGVHILAHDAKLETMTDGAGDVSSRSLAEIDEPGADFIAGRLVCFAVDPKGLMRLARQDARFQGRRTRWILDHELVANAGFNKRPAERTSSVVVPDDAGAGRVAVIGPRHRLEDVRSALRDAGLEEVLRAPGSTSSARAADLDAPVSLLTPRESKGLEFDAVVLLEPADVLATNAGDLYVAMTRPTRALRVIHERDLPVGLNGVAGQPHY